MPDSARKVARSVLFDNRIERDGVTATFVRTVAGVVTETEFACLLAEGMAEDVSEGERLAFQRLAKITFKQAGVTLTVPGVVTIADENWQVIRPTSKENGPDALLETWRIGCGKPIRMAAANK
jgi:hypothetical protein